MRKFPAWRQGRFGDVTLKEVVTFNGAGVGKPAEGATLRQVLDDFTRLSLNADGHQIGFSDPTVEAIYQRTGAAMAC